MRGKQWNWRPGNGGRIQLLGPGHRYFEFCRGHGASIVPLLEVDDLDEANAELVRLGAELLGAPESDGAWTWLTFRAPEPALGGLHGGHAELGQEAAVVGLHPLLGQSPVVVVPERVDHFPFDVLAGGLDWSDGRGYEDVGEVAENVLRAARNLPSAMICSRTIRRLLKAARSVHSRTVSPLGLS